MPQTNQDKSGVLLPNSVGRRFTSSYHAGNAPQNDGATVHARADFFNGTGLPTQPATGYWWISAPVDDGVTHTLYGDPNHIRLRNLVDPTGPGYSGAQISFNASDLNLQEVYVTFEARFPLSGKINGCKFLKIFDKNDGIGGHNVTFGLDYTGVGQRGAMLSVSYDNGSATSGDTGKLIYLDGSSDVSTYNRGSPPPTVSAPKNDYWRREYWGTKWHSFKIRCKRNSGTSIGTETPDGVFEIHIDNELWLSVNNVFNRHYGNSLHLGEIGFGGWTQGGGGDFELDIRKIVISSGGYAI